MRVQGLCASAEACYFAPFDLGRFDHPVHASWLPVAQMGSGQLEAMAGACAAFAAECVVTFEGTLDSLSLNPDGPTSVRLADVRFVSARVRRDGEFFLSRPPVRLDGPRPSRRLDVAQIPVVIEQVE